MGNIRWYKRDPDAALGGMMGLTLEERGAYNTVLDLIYSQSDKLLDDDFFIAGWCQVDVRVWKRIKSVLIKKEKLATSGGLLRNFRATCEVKSASQRIEQKAEAGRIGGAKSAIARKNINNLVEAPAAPPAAQPLKRPVNTTTTTTTTTLSIVAGQQGKFEEFDAKLRALKGIEKQPIAANPDISPLWSLTKQGFDPMTEIIPSVAQTLLTARPSSIRTWAYFVGRIQDARLKSASQPAQEIDWAQRLDDARFLKSWGKAWGPIPKQPGCLVPPALLQPTDGDGWPIYDPYERSKVLPSPVLESVWIDRLTWARVHAKWKPAWGNAPNQSGCAAPKNLIQPTDGQEWGVVTE